MILLDTNVVIAVLNDRPRQVGDMLLERLDAGHKVAVSSIVIFELRYGVANSARKQSNMRKLQGFLAGAIEVLPFDEGDAAVAGDLRAALRALGTPIGPYDVLIAGQALRHKATLVTANTREFVRVTGLNVEDWSAV